MGELIVEKARELFFTYGLRSISMDDLARQAGLSKKTLYLSIADKQELIGKVVDELIMHHEAAIMECRQKSLDAVWEALHLSCLPFDTLASINVSFFHELEKYFPAEWIKLIEHRDKMMIPAITDNLLRGRAEGIYRSDFDIDCIAAVRLQQIITALNPVGFLYKSGSGKTLMTQLTHFYLHGITNTKGKRLINKYTNLNNEKKAD